MTKNTKINIIITEKALDNDNKPYNRIRANQVIDVDDLFMYDFPAIVANGFGITCVAMEDKDEVREPKENKKSFF